MPERKVAMKGAKQNGVIAKPSKGKGFSDEEKAAIRERVREVQRGGKVDDENAVREKIAAMQPSDRAMAERLHGLIKANAPELSPKLWYGMPAYAKDGKIVCFFQDAKKFKTRYATFGFSDKANLDEGGMWPNSYALMRLTPAEEAKITALVRKAVS